MKNRYHSSKIERLLKDLDWDCNDQLHLQNSLNIVHWYPASFITSVPGNIIDIFSESGDVVWDPFCGSGTTAVEAFRKGRHFYGNDISEIAVLVANSKVCLIKNKATAEKAFERLISDLEQLDFNLSFNQFSKSLISAGQKGCNTAELNHWYDSITLQNLFLLKGFLEKSYTHSKIWPVLHAMFLNIAKLGSAQQKTWGHIADNVRPTAEQMPVGGYPVIATLIKRLKQVNEHLKKTLVTCTGGTTQIKVANAQTYTPPKNVDLIVTSPPYPAMADYVTSQRLDYYWLGNSSADINELKKSEIGARYHRHNSARNEMYLRDMRLSLTNIVAALKRNGILVLILPDYPKADPRQKTMLELYSTLEVLAERLYEVPRNIDEMNRWSPFRSLKKETLSIWTKK